MALLETWVEENYTKEVERSLPMGYTWHWIGAKRTKSKGRPAGGIVVGIKKELVSGTVKTNSQGSFASISFKIDEKWYEIMAVYSNPNLEAMKEDLERIIRNCSRKRIILAGDLNARIGTLGGRMEGDERQTRDPIINEEGEKWLDFLTSHQLKLLNGNTDGDTEGHITRPGYRGQASSTLDYGAANPLAIDMIRSFTVGTNSESDHFPLEIILGHKVEEKEKYMTIQQWNTDAISRYRRNLAHAPGTNNWNELHGKLWAATVKRVKRVNGARGNQGWWNTDCYNARRAMLDALLEAKQEDHRYTEYQAAKRHYKECIKRAKNDHAAKVKEELDQVANISQGWDFMARHGNRSRTRPAKRPREGQFLEHFKNLLQGENTTSDTGLTVNEGSHISRDEWIEVWNTLKRNKAAGPDQLKAESFIYADENVREDARIQVERVLNGAPIPAEWTEAVIYPIYKKGNPELASNYRGIAIGNVIYKLLSTLLNQRLKVFVETNNVLPDTQNGFRSGRSTVDNLYIMNQCVQSQLAKEEKLYALFVDFKTAFDQVNRTKLFGTLSSLKVPGYIIDTIGRMYQNTSYRVEEKKFQSYRGLKQGCPLSPLLFAIYICELDNTLKRNCLGGLVLGGKKVFCLAFADDVILIAKSPGELKDMTRRLVSFSKSKDLQVNEEKTKVMVFNRGSRLSKEAWKIGEMNFEEVKTFVYLGVVFQQNGEFTQHHRMTAKKANIKTTEIWSLGERLFPTSYRTRTDLFRSIVLPMILYAAEVTGYAESPDYEKILRRFTRWTLGLPDGTKNAIVEAEGGQRSIMSERFARAAKYESNIPHRKSELLRAAYKEVTNQQGHKWAEARRKRWQHLGWSDGEAQRRMSEPNFWITATNRMRDQENQRLRAACQGIPWYNAPKEGIPMYLRKNSATMKLVSRFRCGAETPGDQTWRGEMICRICFKEPETSAHLVYCGGQGEWKSLTAESGNGAKGMREILSMRKQ